MGRIILYIIVTAIDRICKRDFCDLALLCLLLWLIFFCIYIVPVDICRSTENRRQWEKVTCRTGVFRHIFGIFCLGCWWFRNRGRFGFGRFGFNLWGIIIIFLLNIASNGAVFFICFYFSSLLTLNYRNTQTFLNGWRNVRLRWRDTKLIKREPKDSKRWLTRSLRNNNCIIIVYVLLQYYTFKLNNNLLKKIYIFF